MAIRYPDGNVLLRNLSRNYPIVSHGEGIYLFDTEGKRYLDASGGALVVSVGHGNREVVSQIVLQLEKVAYVNGTHFTSRAAEELATLLVEKTKHLKLNRCSFLGSGSEAIEAAVKFARQLWVERGQPSRSKFIARTPEYHGNTLYALSASGRPHYKRVFGPLLSDVILVDAPYAYRAKGDVEYYSRIVEEAIVAAGPETVAGFIFEPVIGSSAGASVPPKGYFESVEKICRRHGVLLIADEIMCGAGRTGKFLACDHFKLKPDILVLGKGVAGGYAPLSVVMVQEEHVDEMKRGSGSFMHAQTFLQAPSMAAAGLAVMRYMERHQVVEHSEKVGKHLHDALRSRILPHANVGHVGGLGLFAGVEFVEDKASKRPFSRAKKVAEAFTEYAFTQGLILWPNTGQADGVNGDLVMLGPPLTITEKEIDELVGLLDKAIEGFFRK